MTANTDTIELSNDQILLIAKSHFKVDHDTGDHSLNAYCDSVRAVITSYGLAYTFEVRAEAAHGPMITFVVDVATYRESHRTTYQVRVARSDRPKGDPLDSTGITTVFISEKREEAETERAAWDAFLHGAHPTCDMDFVCALINTLRATQRADEPAPSKPVNRSVTYRHLKSGNDYEVLHVNAVREDDGVSLVVYRSVTDRTVYVRPQSEFFAKFVEVIALEGDMCDPPAPTQLYSYAESADAERWHGQCSSIPEAIAEALGEYGKDPDRVVYIGENEPFEPNYDSLVEEVIERISEQAYDEVGEVADTIGPFSEEERKPLADAIKAWTDQHADITCWSVEQIKAYRPGEAEYEQARELLAKKNMEIPK